MNKVITQEDLFQWNVEQVLEKIDHDYGKEIIATYETRKDILTFEDWLSINPEILGRYMMEQLTANFDFEQFINK
jgi:hypothetical protein